jgi:hypothetical protein
MNRSWQAARAFLFTIAVCGIVALTRREAKRERYA